jgi:hypothetical protein
MIIHSAAFELLHEDKSGDREKYLGKLVGAIL